MADGCRFCRCDYTRSWKQEITSKPNASPDVSANGRQEAILHVEWLKVSCYTGAGRLNVSQALLERMPTRTLKRLLPVHILTRASRKPAWRTFFPKKKCSTEILLDPMFAMGGIWHCLSIMSLILFFMQK